MFYLVLKTRARRLAINFDVAGPKLKRSVDDVDRFSRHTGRQKGSEVKRAVLLNATRDDGFRKRLVDGQLEMRIRLVVFQIDVVPRLVFFGERCFQDQGFDFIVRNDDLDVCDLSYQRVGLAVERSRLSEV